LFSHEYRAALGNQRASKNILAGRMLGETMSFAAKAEICGDGEPVEYVHEVVTGAVRTVKVLADGRRKILGFHFAGDIFALEDGNEHSLSAEAVVRSSVRVIKLRTLLRLAANDRELAGDLLTTTMCQLARARRHALLLALTARERVNEFLIEMAERLSVGDLIQLPMTRQDIANYLGLTVETVSRTITDLKGASMIGVPSRDAIVVRDRSAFERQADTGA
jgi:CRP/FNR family nitrogen fixation transcriptional regulator